MPTLKEVNAKMPEMKASPRVNPMTGKVADFLKYLKSPQSSQQMQGLMSVLPFVDDLEQVLDDASYGRAPVQGKGMTLNLTPKGKSMVELATIFAPGGRLAKDATVSAIRSTKGMPIGMSIKDVSKVYPQEEALKLAQQRAALPVEQGGLGLPKDNTPMDRAKAMGFNIPAYHTSRTGVDTDVLDSGKYAIAPFDSIGTHFGTKEAALDRFNRTTGTTEQIKGSSYPVLLKGDKPYLTQQGEIYREDPLAMMLSEKSDYGNLPKSNANLRAEIFENNSIIPYINDVEATGSISYIAPPESIRSRFAAFDPFRRNAAIAATMGVAAPNLLAQERNPKKTKPKSGQK